MEFPAAIKSCMGKYTTFSGRASRSEFWFFRLFVFLVVLAAEILDKGTSGKLMGSFYAISAIVFFLPQLSADIRRLHDLNKSGWAWWIVLIPIIGFIMLIIWFCTKGTQGDNRYGPDPLAPQVIG